MIKSDPTKQIVIMAQSATRLAVENTPLLENGDMDFKTIGNNAHKLMEVELKLAGHHIESLKIVAEFSRQKDVKKIIASIKDEKTFNEAWNSLSEEEQLKLQEKFNEIRKKLK